MKLVRVGNGYHNFFKSNLKQLQYVPNQDGFNMSMILLEKNRFLFSVRFLGTKEAYKGERVVPGNYSTKRGYIRKKLGDEVADKIDFGWNFFWNSWNSGIIDNTVLFVGTLDLKTLEITPDPSVKPHVFHELPTTLKELPYKYSDVRLIRIKEKIFAYDGYISGIHEITLSETEVTAKPTQSELCLNIRAYDKNWAFFTANKDTLVFLNWFEDDKVTLSHVPLNDPKNCLKTNLIEMKKDKIPALGTPFLPMFCFGTPLVEITKDKLWVGLGHTKVITRLDYENPKMEEFKKQCDVLIRQKHKDNVAANKPNPSGRFIQHASYYYSLYYFTVEKKKEKYQVRFSNSYLYVLPSEKYTFSINFPMSITKINSQLYISLGIGDYYNCILKESIEKVKSYCVHDLEKFDQTKYEMIIKIVDDKGNAK
jgi:hypothetical protein